LGERQPRWKASVGDPVLIREALVRRIRAAAAATYERNRVRRFKCALRADEERLRVDTRHGIVERKRGGRRRNDAGKRRDQR
jgi:hypothetical protein